MRQRKQYIRLGMASRGTTMARNLMKYGDIMPQPVVFAGPPSWRGFCLSATIMSLAIAFGILFTYQYFTERITIRNEIATQHMPKQFRMRCVSYTGCNVTHVFTPGTLCAQRISTTPGRVFYGENATFIVTTCFDENIVGDGVVITSIYRTNEQLTVRKKTWIAEIAQLDRPGLALASMHDLQLRISRLHSVSTIKQLWQKKHLLSFRWSLKKTENDYPESGCPSAVSLPNGVTCAGYLLKPTRIFEQNVTQLRNSVLAVIALWLSLLIAAINIGRTFSSVKLRPEQLNVVVEPFDESVDIHATDTQFGVELEDESDKDI